MVREHEYGLEPVDEMADVPRVVEEAWEVLSTYTWQLLGTGAAAGGIWLVAGYLDYGVSALWLVPVALFLAFLYVVPITREPRLAREVLRRWDQLRVERALESSGISGDARLEVAESMAVRIIRHPAVDQRAKDATRAMVARLRRLLHDARRTSYLARTQVAAGDGEMERSLSDLQDLLDARAADILSQLAQLHRTVVLRDSGSLERVVSAVEELARELEAEQEVERLLASAERDGRQASG